MNSPLLSLPSKSTHSLKEGQFHLPGASDRTVIIGGTGTGKTTFGAWILSKQRFDKRAWVAIDFKHEELWDQVGDPPMRELSLGSMPSKTGFYRLHVQPGQEDEFENWLWKVWERGNIGLFCDEFSLVPQRAAMKACLRQGRSKLIPIIACTQRPVDCDREIFTEATYVSVFRLDDIRDYKIIKGFTRDATIEAPLRPHWSFWYDKARSRLITLKPCPEPSSIVKSLKAVVPYSWSLWR
jgi:hypothetical protein